MFNSFKLVSPSKANTYSFYAIFGEVQLNKVRQALDAVNLINAVIVKPQFFQINALVKTANSPDFVSTKK